MARQQHKKNHIPQTRPAGKPRVFSYLRFSSPEQATGDSWRRQDRERQDWCERHGMTLDDTLTFEDPGISAFRGRHHSKDQEGEGGFADFLLAIKAGLVPPGSVLLVERLDRLTRERPTEAVPTLLDIINRGVSIVTLRPQERVYDRAACNEWGMIELVISVKLANQESEQKSQRVGAAWKKRRKAAVAGEANMTAVCPAWLCPIGEAKMTKGFEVIEEKAKWVKLVFKLAIEGWGVGRITRRLNRETGGVCISRRKRRSGSTKWHDSYVAKLLKSRTVLGEYQPHEDCEQEREGEGGRREVVLVRVPVGPPLKGYYPALVSEEDWARAQLAMADRRTGSGGPNNVRVRNLFGSLLVCARTRDRARIVDKGKKGQSDLRLETGLGGTAAQPFEDAMLRLFSEELQLAAVDESAAVREADALQARIDLLAASIEAKAAELRSRPDSPLWGIVSDWDREREQLAEQLAAAKLRIATRPAEDMDRLKEALRELAHAPEDQRVAARLKVRSRLKRVVDRIYVLVTREPYYHQYRLHWRAKVIADVHLRDGQQARVSIMPDQLVKGLPRRHQGDDPGVLRLSDWSAFRWPVGWEEDASTTVRLCDYADMIDAQTLLGPLDVTEDDQDALREAWLDMEEDIARSKQGDRANVVLVVDGVERHVDAYGMNLGRVLSEQNIDPNTVRISGVAGVKLNFVPRDGQRFILTSK